MKTKATSLLLIAAYFISGRAANAIVTMGPDAELFATGTAQISYNDNVLLSHSNVKSDTVFDLEPGIQYTFGQSSNTTGQFSYVEDFQSFSTNSDLNADLAKLDFNTHYDDTATKIDFNSWFHQADQATRDVRSNDFLIHRDLSHVSIIAENKFTDKSSLSAGITYDDTDYIPTQYDDWRWIEVPVRYYYKVEPKLDLSFGVRYRDNQISGNAIDSHEYYYSVGARGEITPKLTGEFSIGYIDFQPAIGQSQGALGMESNFTYAFSPKASLIFGVTNQYGYSVIGQSYRHLDFSAGIQVLESSNLTISLQGFYSRYTYTTTTERDGFWTGQVAANYIVNKNITLTAAYSNANDSSNYENFSFSNNILSVSAVFRY